MRLQGESVSYFFPRREMLIHVDLWNFINFILWKLNKFRQLNQTDESCPLVELVVVIDIGFLSHISIHKIVFILYPAE